MNSWGVIPQINEGFRTRDEQLAVGRTGTTPAAPGQSWHEVGTAVDILIGRGADGRLDSGPDG
ncbi:MAG: hypothetical protein DMG14_25210 [Acidobacteria bacterium]|nr:MAG: hypothetical protein DMG14_25210 [Acidobacteriota bacterium]